MGHHNSYSSLFPTAGMVSSLFGSFFPADINIKFLNTPNNFFPIPGTYVDYPRNRVMGRVGKPLGSHVKHKDGSFTLSYDAVPYDVNKYAIRVEFDVPAHSLFKVVEFSNRFGFSWGKYRLLPAAGTYVDNTYNWKVSRIGKPLGSHVVHNDGSATLVYGARNSLASVTISCFDSLVPFLYFVYHY